MPPRRAQPQKKSAGGYYPSASAERTSNRGERVGGDRGGEEIQYDALMRKGSLEQYRTPRKDVVDAGRKTQHRKRLSSAGTADLAARSGTLQTKYGDFVVVGNMVMLCEGANSEEALERCEPLVDLLTNDQG